MTLTKKQTTLLMQSFDEKVISRKELEKKISTITQDTTKVIKNMRTTNNIQFLFKQHYYIFSEEEKKTGVQQYSFFELIAVVLNKRNIKWYFGLQTANELNKESWQATKTIHVINNKISKQRTINKQKIQFHKVRNIGEYTKHKTKNRIQLHIATKEQTKKDYEKLKSIHTNT